MKAWFTALSQREQMILLSGGGALLLIFLYSLLWVPLSEQNDRLREDIQQQRATLAWMEKAALQIQPVALKASSGRSESLLTLVDRTAKAAKLGAGIKRIQPDKDGSVRIWLEDVKFDQLIKWLAKLSVTHGVVLDSGNIEKQEIPALVDARFTLKGGA